MIFNFISYLFGNFVEILVIRHTLLQEILDHSRSDIHISFSSIVSVALEVLRDLFTSDLASLMMDPFCLLKFIFVIAMLSSDWSWQIT